MIKDRIRQQLGVGPDTSAVPSRLSRISQIMPNSGVSGHTLTIVMTIMCYLACLALGALIFINTAIDAWTSDITRQVTVQVRPVEGADIEAEVAKAVDILRGAPGILFVNPLSVADAAALLEPWLGAASLIDELPIPRIIEVGIDRDAAPDLAALGARIEAEVSGATLDTHRRWQDQLNRMAGSLRLIGYAVLALISTTTIAIIVFATRSAMYSNRRIVEVLHLVGAEDQFIAVQIQRHFLKLGLRGGLIGAFAGAATFTALNLLAEGSAGGVSYALDALATGTYGFSLASYLLLLLVPLVATLISVVTARLAIIHILREVL
jgi:cell division transport system permease protein